MNGSLGVPICDDAHQLRIGAKLSVDLCFSAHSLYARAGPQRRHLQHEGVAGNYRFPEARLFDSSEEDELLIAVFNLAEREDCSTLGHRFDNQDSRHDRRARKMSLEKCLIDGHLFDADNPLTRGKFDNPVDQEKRITMRQEFLDRFRVENRFHTRVM
jgi:hypothetical protein